MASRAFRQTRAPHPHRRTCRRIALSCAATSALLFVLSPLGALWGLAAAVQHGDVVALRQGMDWRALRIALKGDLSDVLHPAVPVKLASARVAVSAVPAAAAADDELPEFGSSFVSGVVSNAVDDEVTPEHLLALMRPDGNDPVAAAPFSIGAVLHRVTALAFTAPDRFEAAIIPSDQPEAEPVRLTLRIERWHWKVVAVHLPDSPVPVSTADARRT